MDYVELRDRIDKLPITQENISAVYSLLSMPYEVYRPIMDELLFDRIVLADLIPIIKRSNRKKYKMSGVKQKKALESLLADKIVDNIQYRDFAKESNKRLEVISEYEKVTGLKFISIIDDVLVEPEITTITRISDNKQVQLENARLLEAAKLSSKME
jgi:hypothetical protein